VFIFCLVSGFVLTIKGVTKTVNFDVVYTGTVKDPSGDTRAGFKLTGNVNRYDYGLKWNMILEAGGLFVSENVAIVCNIELLIAKAK
jgi:polyisoprenoid-binding protein YceI